MSEETPEARLIKIEEFVLKILGQELSAWQRAHLLNILRENVNARNS